MNPRFAARRIERWRRRAAIRPLIAALFVLLPAFPAAPADDAGELMMRAMGEKSSGHEALSVIENLIAHETILIPTGTDSRLKGLLGSPARLAGRIPGLEDRYMGEAGISRRDWTALISGAAALGTMACPNPAMDLDRIIDWYVAELGRILRPLLAMREACASADDSCPDVATVVRGIADGAASRRTFRWLEDMVARNPARRLAPAYVELHGRLLDCLRNLAPGDLAAVAPAVRETAFGRVVVGSAADDSHRTGNVFLIVDVGGNDRYQLTALAPGTVRSLIDLGGNDVYQGVDLAVLAASAILDLAGDDRYESQGPGQAATLGGLALLVDVSGNDRYRAGDYGQGAAAFGVGALIDGGGADRYRIHALGQGLGETRGIGVLWDLGGDDTYVATGRPGPVDLGGGLSWAQGVGRGLRRGLAGGLGLLLDDGGDDTYRAQLFAQGSGYYFALGLLRDRSGNDRYSARRYAQGAGVHTAIGILDDMQGDDQYQADVGVSQGMGLDTAIGLLRDGGGGDVYSAGSLAQGASTANGIGILLEEGGRDRFSLGASGWGQDHWSRGLPGTAFLLGVDAADAFTFGEKGAAAAPGSLSGPHGLLPPRSERPGRYRCPDANRIPRPVSPVADPASLLRRSAPKHGLGRAALDAYAALVSRLPDGLADTLKAVPWWDFATTFSLREVVRCWLGNADAAAAEAARRILTGTLTRAEPSRRPWFAGGLLAFVPGPPRRHRDAIEALFRHPSCGARSLAIHLARRSLAGESAVPPWIGRVARRALGDGCWRLQAAAMHLLDQRPDLSAEFGKPPAHLPGFLRDPVLRARARDEGEPENPHQ